MQIIFRIALIIMTTFILWAAYSGIKGAITLAQGVKQSRTDMRVEVPKAQP